VAPATAPAQPAVPPQAGRVVGSAACPGPAAGSLAEIAARIGASGELVEAARLRAKRPDNVLGLLLRDLSREEIAVMEDRGCRADDWSLVQVAKDFDPFRVRRTHLRGRCVLGRFSAEVEVLPGLRLASGIYDCTLADCQIGNDALLESVRFAAQVVVDREAVLADIGSITGRPDGAYGCGALIPIGPETGGREVPLWGELLLADAAQIAKDRADAAGQRLIAEAAARYRAAVAGPVTWVRRGARIRHTTRIDGCWIGTGAVVDDAAMLADCAILSSAEEPVRIEGGAEVVGSVLQAGVKVAGKAIVRGSCLCEHSGADAHATVEHSILGPNTRVQKGEITASLVGPHVGFHHQSLLIACLWPEGKGNIAYGAMVGSNHTGRAPDQECWPGEGAFFGLGCSIRYPADYSEAPYLTVSMGVTTLPQRVTFPFSLIAVPTEGLGADEGRVPRAYNELVPGWALFANAYGLVRTELKVRDRDRSKRQPTEPKVLRPAIMRQVRCAWERLRAVREPKAVYLDDDIPGIGRNVLRESARLKAIDVYGRALTRYALRLLLNEREGRLELPGSAEIAHELADLLLPGTGFAERMARLVEIERRNAELVQASKAKDDERGAGIIPGYADAHVAAAADPVVQSAWDRVRRTAERVAAVTG
jgi:hypothetical protein